MADLKISRSTKSKAYTFIKSLMADGAEGADVHKLVAAISDNVSEDIGGAILMDLIRNEDDTDGDIKHKLYWFGPFPIKYYDWIIGDWAEYCRDTELRGIFRFGKLKQWQQWNKQNNNKYTDDEIQERYEKTSPAIMVFEWWSDRVVTKDVQDFLNDLYDRLDKRQNEEK